MIKRLTCFRCDSQRVLRGRIIGHMGHRPRFLPEKSKFFNLALSTPYLKIEYKSFICVDCGLFWSITDAPTAREKIQNWAKDGLKSSLKL